MARPQKEGLDYFPFNVDFFEDDKLQLIEAEFGEKGLLIAIKLLCKIYKENGYYYQWGEDECLLFSRKAGAGFVPGLVKEVVTGLVRRSFFDKGVFDKFNILTSCGIQKRFFDAAERRKSVTIIKEFLLFEDVKEVNVHINAVYVSINPQSKVKKSKEEEREAQAPTASQELIVKYSKFTTWLGKYAPNVLKMKEPITIKQYEKLLVDFPGKNELLTEVLMAMHNKADLLKKYTSANLTLRNWIKLRNEKQPAQNGIDYHEERQKSIERTKALAES